MPSESIQRDHVDHVLELLARAPDDIDDFLSTLSGSDVIHTMFSLSEADRKDVLIALEAATAAEFIEDVPDPIAADLIEALPSEDAASIMAELPSDERADVLAEVEADDLERILSAMPDASAADAREFMAFEAASAGGLMVREYLAFQATTSAGEALNTLTDSSLDLSRFALRYAYVLDEDKTLIGVVRTKNLVNLAPATPLSTEMQLPTLINVGADLTTCDESLAESEDVSLPVVDDRGRMLGVLPRSNVDQALVEKAEDDHLKSQGILNEELRSMPLNTRAGRRLSWLSINVFLNLIAASVIAAFEDTLAAVITLAVFLPIVSDMSGCSGNQAVAVSMRELTLGVTGTRDALRVWWQEIKVGLINGLALGALLGIAAYLWKGSLGLSLVVAMALGLNTVIAVSIGGTVPILLKRFGIDPAVASGPLLTTVTDMCGFFLVLSIATLTLDSIVLPA